MFNTLKRIIYSFCTFYDYHINHRKKKQQQCKQFRWLQQKTEFSSHFFNKYSQKGIRLLENIKFLKKNQIFSYTVNTEGTIKKPKLQHRKLYFVESLRQLLQFFGKILNCLLDRLLKRSIAKTCSTIL